MTNFAARIAGIATLALAVLPLAAITTAAHAETAVRVADLDLNSARGVAAFHQRVAVAADKFCRDERGLSARQTCVIGVRTEMREKLAAAQLRQFASR
jgi:UrcA family protein